MRRMRVITPDGQESVTEFESGQVPDFRQLQAAVGGYLEALPGHWFFTLPAGALVYVNGDGKFDGLQPNTKAMLQLGYRYAFRDTLVGPVVVLDGFSPEEL